MDVGLVTCARFPELLGDEMLLQEGLGRRGITAGPVVWDDPDVDWASLRAAVLRSTWDYTARHGEFVSWAGRTGSVCALWNSAAIVLWNSHKGYLVDLAERGVPVIPTTPLPRTTDAMARIEEGVQRWGEVVLKPAVGASADGVRRLSAEDLLERRDEIEVSFRARDLIVQPYLRSIESEGEVSVVLVDGGVTHAVRKLPARGEFRVQQQHGGSLADHEATDTEIEIARRALAALGADTLYARADLVLDGGGRTCLGELELIEPELFLTRAPAAVERRLAAT